MGRPPTASGRLSLDVDPALKLRLSMAALKSGQTVTAIVERGITLALAELRDKAKDEDK